MCIRDSSGTPGLPANVYLSALDPTLDQWSFPGEVGSNITIYNRNNNIDKAQTLFTADPRGGAVTWVAANSAINLTWVADASTPQHGQGYLRWEASATGNLSIARLGAAVNRFEAVAGQDYTWMAWVYAEDNTEMSLNIGLYNAQGGSFQGQVVGPLTTVGQGQWVLLTLPYNAPVGANFIQHDVRGRNVTAGQRWRIGPVGVLKGNWSSLEAVPASLDSYTSVTNPTGLTIAPIVDGYTVGENEAGGIIGDSPIILRQGTVVVATLDPNDWPEPENPWTGPQGEQYQYFGNVTNIAGVASRTLGDIWIETLNTNVHIWDDTTWRKIGSNA